ncbi:hypothetical protein KR222_000747, partial [Zaprionus bogoriensis]
MQLITRVLLLAVTVLGASAWPRIADEQSLLRMVMASMREERALSPGESACLNAYNNATNKNLEELSNATSKCEEAANRTTISNNQNSNSSVTVIRNQLLSLEKNLQLCRNETDQQVFINCTVSYFDKNLQLLDESNSLAYQTQSQFASNSTIVAAQRSNCIKSAVSELKVKSIEAANNYDACLLKLTYQREPVALQQLDIKEIAQQKPEEKPVQKPEQKPDEQPEQRPAQR